MPIELLAVLATCGLGFVGYLITSKITTSDKRVEQLEQITSKL